MRTFAPIHKRRRSSRFNISDDDDERYLTMWQCRFFGTSIVGARPLPSLTFFLRNLKQPPSLFTWSRLNEDGKRAWLLSDR